MAKITPYSQIINIVLFVPFALLTTALSVLIAQAIFITITSLVFKIHIKIRFYHFIAILPVLIFILIVNSLHGGGEILLRFGPLFILKQGVLKGIFYTIFILELFFMSRVLTSGFTQEELLSSFYTIDRFLGKVRVNGRFYPRRDNGGFMVILYYVMKLFYNSYSELKPFFTQKAVPLKQRVLFYMRRVFIRSLEEFKGRDYVGMEAVLPNRFDYIDISFQLVVLVSSLMLQRILF
ncbi:MAG: hypothetical protein ACUVWJ_02095 [Spirochaetota bacterium]